MKIMIIANHSYTLWQFRKELITAFLQYGEVIIATPLMGREKEFAEMGCHLISVPMDRRGTNPCRDLSLYRRYVRLLREEMPDFVLTYSIKPNIYAGYACRRIGIPYFSHVQGLGSAFQRKGLARFVTILYRIALKKAKAVFFENREDANAFISRRIVSRERTVVLCGAGINLAVYAEKPYPSEKNGIRFLFVGRMMREKGIEEFFAAATILKQKYGTAVQFEIAGSFEEDYRETVKHLEEQGILTCHAFSEDPRPLYEKAHCLVLPSYHEGMSNVLLEAAAVGRALIATDIPGCREIVRNGENGFLCQKANVADLLRCLERFLALDRETRAELGREGHRIVAREFRREIVVQDTLLVMFGQETAENIDVLSKPGETAEKEVLR